MHSQLMCIPFKRFVGILNNRGERAALRGSLSVDIREVCWLFVGGAGLEEGRAEAWRAVVPLPGR